MSYKSGVPFNHAEKSSQLSYVEWGWILEDGLHLVIICLQSVLVDDVSQILNLRTTKFRLFEVNLQIRIFQRREHCLKPLNGLFKCWRDDNNIV